MANVTPIVIYTEGTSATFAEVQPGDTIPHEIIARPAVKTISDATYTVQAEDHIVRFMNACTVTLPNDLPSVFRCTLVQMGSGVVTIEPADGAVVSEVNRSTAGQYTAIDILGIPN